MEGFAGQLGGAGRNKGKKCDAKEKVLGGMTVDGGTLGKLPDQGGDTNYLKIK